MCVPLFLGTPSRSRCAKAGVRGDSGRALRHNDDQREEGGRPECVAVLHEERAVLAGDAIRLLLFCMTLRDGLSALDGENAPRPKNLR